MEVLSETIRKIFENKKVVKSMNRNRLIDMRYDFIENFDKMYTINFATTIYKSKPKNFLAIQFLQYCLIFDGRDDKLEFCKKFINRLEIDKEGFFINNQKAKMDLLFLFKIEWDSLRRTNNMSQTFPEFKKRLSRIEKNTDAIAELQKGIEFLIKRMSANKRKGRKRTTRISFMDIFLKEDYGIIVKSLLKENNYISKDGIWRGETGKSNELAVLFYLLKLPKYGLCVIRSSDNKNSIIAFYLEFGLKVDIQGETGGYCTYGNISQEPGASEIRTKFKLIFTSQELKIQ